MTNLKCILVPAIINYEHIFNKYLKRTPFHLKNLILN